MNRCMRPGRFWLGIPLLVCAMGAYAAAGDPLGAEFEVPEQSSGTQHSPAVARHADGSFVVAWAAGAIPDSVLVLRRYAADGQPLGGDVVVATNAPESPALATGRGGEFVLVWTGDAGDGSGRAVYAHYFEGSGQPSGAPIRVSQPAEGDAAAPAVALDRFLQWTVVWSRSTPDRSAHEVLARVYMYNGPRSEEVLVTPSASPYPPRADVAMFDHPAYGYHHFIVAWNASGVDAATSDIWARRYNPEGQPLEEQRRASPEGEALRHDAPAVAADCDGNFLVSWRRLGEDDSAALFAQRFASDGVADAAPISLTAATAGERSGADLAMDCSGDFTAAWAGRDPQTLDWDVYARRYEASGTPRGDESVVHTASTTVQHMAAAVSVDADGDETVVWASNPDQPGSQQVFARRFRGPQPVDLVLAAGSGGSAEPGSLLQARFTVQPPEHAYAQWPSAQYYEGDATGVQVELTTSPPLELFGSADAAWDCSGSAPVICRLREPIGAATSLPELSVDFIAPPQTGEVVVNGRVFAEQSDPDEGNNAAAQIFTIADQTPDAFAFEPQSAVPRSSLRTSSAIRVSGIDGAVPIQVYGLGSYSVNGGPFGAGSGSVVAGDEVRLQHVASADWSATVETGVAIGNAWGSFRSTTEAQDTRPEPFAFAPVQPVPRDSEQTSAAITVTGINDGAPISVTGGSYSIDGNAYTNESGSVQAGQSVRLRHTAASGFGAQTETVLSIGGVQGAFASVTEARDAEPDAFAFATAHGVPRQQLVSSEAVVITGINDGATVAISGGSYSIDGAAFTSAAGTAYAGQSLRVRHTAAGEFSTATETVLSVGGMQASFTSVTEAADATPEPFSFTDTSGVATGQTQTSDAITVPGINTAAPVAVSGGSYSINGGVFTSADGMVQPGDQLRLRHVSAGSAETVTETRLTVGGVSDTFSSTTGATDATPDAFSFTDVTSARTKSRVTSNAITVSGINTAVAISIAGADAQYSMNGGAYTSASGTVQNGDSIRLRVTAAATAKTAVNVSVTIGGVGDTWTVTTQ